MSMTFSRKAVIIYTLAVIAVFAFVAGCGNDGMHAYSGPSGSEDSSHSADWESANLGANGSWAVNVKRGETRAGRYDGKTIGLSGSSNNTEPEAGPGRKIIMTYDLKVKVEEFAEAFDAAAKLAESSGGYALNTRRQQADNGSVSGWVVMRVPKDRAGGALAELRKLGEVVEESSTGDDITEEYVDQEARLRNMRASEERLLGLMKTRTTDLKDLLTVEKELTRVRGEIESIQAQIRSWDTLTAMSTIKLSLHEPDSPMPSKGRFWGPIASAFGEALEGFANSTHYAIIFIGAVLPWLLLMGIIAYITFIIVRRSARKNKKEEKPAE